MSFLDNLQKNMDEINNLSVTENGAIGYKSTGKKLLDMNFNVPKYRKMSASDICVDFAQACDDNELLAILWAFFARDARGGLGERRLFRILFDEYCYRNPNAAAKLLPLIAEYGRWDDVVEATIGTPVWNDAVQLIKTQLLEDVKHHAAGKSVSLLAKWLPSERTSSKASREKARQIAHDLGCPIKNYNRMLATLRKHIGIVESQMSAQQWENIDYAAVPSCANLLYKNAFLKHDADRRKAYLEALKHGDTKINAGVLFPHEIVHRYCPDRWTVSRTTDTALEEMWKALPNMGGLDNTIVVADGSGSMTSVVDPHSSTTALDVANALAIYCAEHCTGEFHNKYITFSETPQFVAFNKCKTLRDKLAYAKTHDEVANTNIEAVFDIILDTAIRSHATQDEIPKNILIVSDMEFDACATCTQIPSRGYYRYYRPVRNPDDALFSQIKKRYEEAGYQLPRLVFWNVNSRTGTIPMRENDLGVTLVSGFSLGIMQMIQSGETDPYINLVRTITSERYQPIIAALQAG